MRMDGKGLPNELESSMCSHDLVVWVMKLIFRALVTNLTSTRAMSSKVLWIDVLTSTPNPHEAMRHLENFPFIVSYSAIAMCYFRVKSNWYLNQFDVSEWIYN